MFQNMLEAILKHIQQSIFFLRIKSSIMIYLSANMPNLIAFGHNKALHKRHLSNNNNNGCHYLVNKPYEV